MDNKQFITNIDNIRNNLLIMTQEEYNKNNIYPTKTVAKTLKEPTDNLIDINKLKNQFKQMHNKKEKINSKPPIDAAILEVDEIKNDLNYNIITNDTIYIEWKKMNITEKIEKIENYFIAKNISDENKELIINMLKENKLNTKKEIIYDKINKRINNIVLLKLVEGQYIFKSSEKKINIKKKNMSNINKLFK